MTSHVDPKRLEILSQNRKRIFEKIQEHSPLAASEVTLICVTKRHSHKAMEDLLCLGETHMGESYVQDAVKKIEALGDKAKSIHFHFIGRLQKNKVKKCLAYFHTIHSVDSLGLMKKISEEAKKAEKRVEVLFQVNTSGEESKTGFLPSALEEAFELYKDLSHIRCIGLMTMAPLVEPEKTRPFFRHLALLRNQWRREFPEVTQLSMGMSNDYIVALEEGATMIRIGSGLFQNYTEERDLYGSSGH
ncbi:MAG: YggS family pyridoxal phosphate-dependent enzyme [Planctomycetota bacterium]|nr:MAG: YggS family pyridoxal phosphate-dependent enzyme [Planctomycetota bacterium]